MLRSQHQHLRATTTIAASRMATGLFAANGLVSERDSWPRGCPAPKRSYGRLQGMQGVSDSVGPRCGE